MTSASGFTWVAREPRLIVGAKGRASAQRSIDYHLVALSAKPKFRASRGAISDDLAGEPGGFAFHLLHSLSI
jgi:hypothetical protein